MDIHRKSILRILPLILLLLASQLQAKQFFSCSMIMDTNDSEISQHDDESCPNLDWDDSTRLNAPISDLVIELDIDPSQEKFTTYTPILQLRTTVLLNSFSRTNYYKSGSKIHLITQRLRI